MSETQYPQSFEKLISILEVKNARVEYFKHFSAEDIEALASGKPLGKKSFKIKAKYLILKGNNLGDSGTAALAPFIRKNKTLRTLEINSNKVATAGAIALGDALKENKFLRKLSLQHNRLNDDAIEAFAGDLVDNKTLAHISFNNNPYGNRGNEALLLLKKKRDSLTIIGKHNKSIHEEVKSLRDVWEIQPLVTKEALATEVGAILKANNMLRFANTFFKEKLFYRQEVTHLQDEDYIRLGIVPGPVTEKLQEAFLKCEEN